MPTRIVDNLLRKPFLSFIALLLLQATSASEGGPNKRYSRGEYIAAWKDVAVEQMNKHGIPASITLAQAILESGDGNSELAREANNHFGIKCHDWQGKKVYHHDDRRNECFRKYESARESFEDHSEFLKRSRYQFLFDYKVTDYKSWAKGLKKAGYATNPKYPELLIRLIEENNLHQYDRPGQTNSKANNRTTGPSPSQTGEIVLNLSTTPQIELSDNRIKYFIADSDYNPEELAERLEMGAWQIYKYNDLKKGNLIEKGDRVYIQPKRNKSKTTEFHVVSEGETLREVSQKYGVKIKKILKYSALPPDYTPHEGDRLRLRR